MLEHVARNASKSSDERKRHKELATTEVGRDRKMSAVISGSGRQGKARLGYTKGGRYGITAGIWVVVSLLSAGLQGHDTIFELYSLVLLSSVLLNRMWYDYVALLQFAAVSFPSVAASLIIVVRPEAKDKSFGVCWVRSHVLAANSL